jgi:hypothetical protein
MKLMDVLNNFTVKNLIDGGDSTGSGIVPLRLARPFVSTHGGHYYAINDANILEPDFVNPALKSIQDLNPTVNIKLLSGSRSCQNANNSSLMVLMTSPAASFIFTGDAETSDDDDCADEISTVLERNPNLHADVYKVGHHGSANGTSDEWVRALAPKVSVISAGRVDLAHQGPGSFHAFQFGHPREKAVQIVETHTSNTRDPVVTVTTMDKVKKIHPNRPMTKAVYCTCWEGDIVIEPSADGRRFRLVTPP